MTKQGLEKGLMAGLFIMVLVLFSFAERDSKKIERLYTAAQALKKSSHPPADVANAPKAKVASGN